MKESSHALHGIDPKKEAALRRKIDLRILPTISLIYLFCFIDVSLRNLRLLQATYVMCASVVNRAAD